MEEGDGSGHTYQSYLRICGMIERVLLGET